MNENELIQVIINWLFEKTEQDALYVAITLVGTSAILSISLALIPFQQYASKYTLSLFKYISKDRKLIIGYLIFLLLITYEFSLVFLSCLRLTIIFAFLGVIISLLLIGYLWKWSTKLLNPKEVIIPTIEKNGIIEVNNLFKKLDRKIITPQEKIEELKVKIQQSIYTAESIDPNVKYDIPREYLSKLENEIIVLKDLCIVFARTTQTEMFQVCYQAIVNITIH